MTSDESTQQARDEDRDPAGGPGGPPGPEAPPPAAPPPPVRQLLRYPDDGVGAGVAAGLGYYFGVDPVLFRIAFVLLAFTGGVGILLYLVGWAVIPEAAAGSPRPPAPGESPRAGSGSPGQPATGQAPERAVQWVGIGLVVVAGLWLVGRFDLVSPPVLWAVALIVLGVLLFRGDLGRSQRHGPPAPPAEHAAEPAAAAMAGPGEQGHAAPHPAPAWGAPAAAAPGREAPGSTGPGGPGAAGGQPPRTVATAPSPPPPAPPSPPEPPSALGRLTVGAALLAGGTAALLDAAGLVEVTFRHYVALVLLVVGLGLVAGAWWGRARWLVAVGLALLPVVLVAGLAGAFVTVGGGVGERFFAPTEAADVRESYELFAGRLELDLTALDFEGREVAVRGRVTFGELVVLVPPDVTVDVDAAVGGGEIRLPARSRDDTTSFPERPVSGLRVDRRVTLQGEPGGGTLDLELTSGFGAISVRRLP